MKDIYPGSDVDESFPSDLTDVAGTLYFSAFDSTHGRELWRSDGTRRGTVLVTDLYRGGKGSRPRSITDLGGTVFFSATRPSTGRELWSVIP